MANVHQILLLYEHHLYNTQTGGGLKYPEKEEEREEGKQECIRSTHLQKT